MLQMVLKGLFCLAGGRFPTRPSISLPSLLQAEHLHLKVVTPLAQHAAASNCFVKTRQKTIGRPPPVFILHVL